MKVEVPSFSLQGLSSLYRVISSIVIVSISFDDRKRTVSPCSYDAIHSKSLSVRKYMASYMHDVNSVIVSNMYNQCFMSQSLII